MCKFLSALVFSPERKRPGLWAAREEVRGLDHERGALPPPQGRVWPRLAQRPDQHLAVGRLVNRHYLPVACQL